MAAYGAAMSGAHRVLVPKNGQGSLGGSLAPRVWAAIDGIARYQERSILEIKETMFALLRQHHAEWTAFLRHCGESSWINRLAEG